MKFGMPAWFGSKKLEKAVGLAKKIGFDYVEVGLDYPWPEKISRSEKKDAIRLAKRLGVGFAFHGPCTGLGLADPREATRACGVKVVGNLLEFSRDFDPLYFNIHLQLEQPTTFGLGTVAYDALAAAKKSAAELVALGQQREVQITFENTPDLIFGLSGVMKNVLPPQAALCLDIGHVKVVDHLLKNSGERDLDVAGWMKLFKKRIIACHLHDVADGRDHLPFGKGELRIREILKDMKKTSVKTASIEIFKKKNGTPGTENDLRLSLLKARKWWNN